MRKKIRFVKVCGFWFVDLPCDSIDRVLDMQMVDGADKLLDEILGINGSDCSVTLNVLDEDDRGDINLRKAEEDEIGATYIISHKSSLDINTEKLWLCNVCKEVLGKHPDYISVNIM